MKADYDTTLARIAGSIAAGMVTTEHFRHRDGVINHQELVAVSVDLARQIVAVCRLDSAVRLSTPTEADK